MNARQLREKYMRKFVGLQKYDRLSAWGIYGHYVSQLIISVIAGTILATLPATPVTVVLGAFLILFIGTRLRGLGNIIHECCHNTFSEHRADNPRIGKLCAVILFSSFKDYQDEHLSHHAHLGDYEHDLDLKSIEDLRLHDALTPRVLWRHLTVPFLGKHLPYYLKLNLSFNDGATYAAMKACLLLFACVYTIAYPLAGLLFLIVPFVFVYSALNYWADCMDHAGLIEAGDDLETSRNVLAPAFVRWLFFPRNDCYHLVHHLFPQIPARHLGRAHENLLQDSTYCSLPNAVKRSALLQNDSSQKIAAE